MTGKEKQEREEVFLVSVLLPNERELYRKYGHLRADEMPTDSGILNLRTRMFDIVHRLALAGMYDDDLPMPYENRTAEEDLFRWSYCNGEDDPFISTFAEFAVMRGGRLWEYSPKLQEEYRRINPSSKPTQGQFEFKRGEFHESED